MLEEITTPLPENKAADTQTQIAEASQRMAEAYGISASEAAERLTEAFQAVLDAIRPALEAATDMIRKLWETLPEAVKRTGGDRDEMLRCIVATPKQWHLYKHGSRRIRKKWKRALDRKAKRLQREEEFDG